MVAGQATANLHAAAGEQQRAVGIPSVAEILRWGAPKAMDINTPAQVRDTLAKLSLCRTHALGGRRFECEDCDEITTRYNSCGDRHCPQCSGGKRVDFHNKASKLILNDVTYYQVVMTLPSELSDLALSNRKLFGDLLPKSAWASLDRSIRTEQAYHAGAVSVLHTWNQHLESHWHVHLLVPGAGPSLANPQRWITATPPPSSGNDSGFYLVDADKLRSRFRDTFIRRLKLARESGKLRLEDRHAHLQSEENWQAFVKNLKSKTWVSYIQPPPTTESVATHVVRYLTRYLTGGPISDYRIVSADRQSVTFMAREGTQVGGERKQVPVTLTTQKFTVLWCQHIQPQQLTKVRYFGGWSNSKVGDYMERCRLLTGALECASEMEEAVECVGDIQPEQPDVVCEHCGSERVIMVSNTPKPSWEALLGYRSQSCPQWYKLLREEDERLFWDGMMGAGFNAWYLEALIESAEEPQPPSSPPLQLDLPGFGPGFGLPSGYLIDSF